MAVGDVHVFPGFRTPLLAQLFFWHVSAEARGKNMPERKFASTGKWTRNLQVMSLTCSPQERGMLTLWETTEILTSFCKMRDETWLYNGIDLLQGWKHIWKRRTCDFLACTPLPYTVFRSLCFFLNPFPHNHNFYQPYRIALWKRLWEQEKMLLFPQCFLLFPEQILNFQSHQFCRLQMHWIWTSLKILSFVKK